MSLRMLGLVFSFMAISASGTSFLKPLGKLIPARFKGAPGLSAAERQQWRVQAQEKRGTLVQEAERLHEYGQRLIDRKEQLVAKEQQKMLDAKLFFAVGRQDKDTVNALLKQGANPNARNDQGYCALEWSLSSYWKGIPHLLLEAGADPNAAPADQKHGSIIMQQMSVFGHQDTVKLLLEAGADPEACDDKGCPLIVAAFKKECFDIVDLLLQKGVSHKILLDPRVNPAILEINKQNAHGETHLMERACNNGTMAVKILLLVGANPYLRDASGLTVFDYAENRPDIAALLSPYKDKSHPSQGNTTAIIQHPAMLKVDSALLEQSEGKTASEVYAKILQKDIKKRLDQGYFTRIPLFPLVQREREYWSTHHPFYHAQSAHHRIVQDFLTELSAVLDDPYPSDFVPVRYPGNKDTFAHQETVDFLQKFNAKMKKIGDGHKSELSKHLLSVNPALFGNISNSGESLYESSLHYFLGNCNDAEIPLKDLLRTSFEYYAFNPAFIQQLAQFQDSFGQQRCGSMLQIFVPKEKVDQCVYLAHAFGPAYEKDLGVGGYDKTLGYQTRISPVLEAIQNGTVCDEKILGTLQARIILSKDMVLNPKGGVKIFRQVDLPEQKLAWYRKQVAAITRDVVIDWLERALKDEIPQEVRTRIAGTPLGALLNDSQKMQQRLVELRKQE